MNRWVAIVVAVMSMGCGGGNSLIEVPDWNDSGLQDKGLDTNTGGDSYQPDLVRVDAMSDSGDFVQETDSTQYGCQPGEGCFLDPCSSHSQCQAGWCMDHMGDGVCTKGCQEECPQGWTCRQVTGEGPDLSFVCVSNFANLCRPCATNADCKSPGGVDDLCISYGEAGSFCGGVCKATLECPWGFTCKPAKTVDGIENMQCVADAGVCPCTAKSISLNLWTPCNSTNPFGTCSGKRVCTEEGLSDCDAQEATKEICNGLDDDCDGSTDEPEESGGDLINLCDDANECTKDTCKGTAGCENSALEGVECKDGDPCTIADSCVAGVCVGTLVDCDDKNPCTDDGCNEKGGCVFTPNTASCDDSNPCTVGDVCKEGKCAGTPVSCDCQSDVDCSVLEDGDLCNGTLVCDKSKLPFQCKVKEGSEIVCPPPLRSRCDLSQGIM